MRSEGRRPEDCGLVMRVNGGLLMGPFERAPSSMADTDLLPRHLASDPPQHQKSSPTPPCLPLFLIPQITTLKHPRKNETERQKHPLPHTRGLACSHRRKKFRSCCIAYSQKLIPQLSTLTDRTRLTKPRSRPYAPNSPNRLYPLRQRRQ